MYKVALIGIGGLGIRHLQGLVNLDSRFEVYGVDVNEELIKKLEDEYKGVQFISTVDKLPENIDVAIIATTSNVRRDVFESLTEATNVRNVIFEKVLFQKMEDYKTVSDIIKKKEIKAWVNCPRREYPSFNELIEKLRGKSIKSISVTGGEWGLGTSCIHFIDFIEFIAGSDSCTINYSGLRGPIIESKRKGYIEFYGYIAGKCGDTDFIISCYDDSNCVIQIIIETEDTYYRIIESKQRLFVSSEKNGWSWDEEELPIPYVSQLTDKIVMSIVESGACRLPSYEVSVQAHIEYLSKVFDLLKINGMEGNTCPIT